MKRIPSSRLHRKTPADFEVTLAGGQVFMRPPNPAKVSDLLGSFEHGQTALAADGHRGMGLFSRVMGAAVGMSWHSATHDLECAPFRGFTHEALLEYGDAVLSELTEAGATFPEILEAGDACVVRAAESISIPTEPEVAEAEGFSGAPEGA